MFVENGRSGPTETLACVDHRASQCDGFVAVERKGGTSGDEGRKMDIGVAALDDVADDGQERRGFEAVSVDAPPYAGEGFDWRYMAGADCTAFVHAKPLPGNLRKP